MPEPSSVAFHGKRLAGKATLNTHINNHNPIKANNRLCLANSSSQGRSPGIAWIIAGIIAVAAITIPAVIKITINHRKLNTRVSMPLTRSGTSCTPLNAFRMTANTALAPQIVVTIENDKIPTPPLSTDLIIGAKIDMMLAGKLVFNVAINSVDEIPTRPAIAPILINTGTNDNNV